MLQEALELQERTSEAGADTMGRARGDLTDEERSEIDRIAERQRDAARRTEELADDLRDRGRVLEEMDAQRSESLQSAARRAERAELSQTMEEAASQIQENRMSNAQQSQQAAVETLQSMLEDLQENQRARAEQLIRQLSSLVQSIERLVRINEDELIALSRIPGPDDATFTDSVSERTDALIRFVRNTESVSSEARSAGTEAQRIARAIDRSADEQGRAILALRTDVIDLQDVEFHLEASLSELQSALEMSREAEQEAREAAAEEKRDELEQLYRNLAEREVGVRTGTDDILPEPGEDITRRNRVRAGLIAVEQESIREDLRAVQEDHPELADSILFDQMHELIDGWISSVVDSLRDGDVDETLLDREDFVIDGLIGLANALADGEPDDDNPFEQNEQAGGEGGSSGQQQQGGNDQLVPPIAELKLLRTMQDQVYRRTRRLSEKVEAGLIDSERIESSLTELGDLQDDLHDLGNRLLESLQEESGGGRRPTVEPETTEREATP
ncbi:MAG: hypothetical protein MK082_13350 [Phycisphaerales bacterium]|nr:hypothetical protein [Phycisphaerales bacterium]